MVIWFLAWLSNCMHCKSPHTALLTKKILFPFILQYQYEFNLFFSAKWLFAQLTRSFITATHALKALSHTHTAVILPQFQPQTRATQSSLGLQGCCCDRQWIFCSPNTHHISGRVMACWRPMSLTVPASANGGQ